MLIFFKLSIITTYNENKDPSKNKRGNEEKKERMDKDELKHLIFELYDDKDSYHINDLDKLTNQPKVFLKILIFYFLLKLSKFLIIF